VKDEAGGRAITERFSAKFGDKFWNWVGRLNPEENFES
jgi:hypothetical protein